jgi:hypothetical protein
MKTSCWTLSILVSLTLPLSPPEAKANAFVHPPDEDSFWPILVFAEVDSFLVRYDRFFRSHFGAVAVDRLPTWLEIDLDSLVHGERFVARLVAVGDDDEKILAKLQELVSMNGEIAMTQFGPEPRFPSESFVLGHKNGSVTLVPYNAMEVKAPLEGLDVVDYLKRRGAFMTDGDRSNDLVVLSRGNVEEVDIWYPRMAREVLHTHTIPGNINPTGYLEFFEGSDRDLIVSTYVFQEPIRMFLLSRRGSAR